MTAAYAVLRAEAAGVDERDLRPWPDARWRHVFPREPAVGGDVDEPVVGPHPDAPDVLIGRRNRVDDAALLRLRGRILAVLADACRRLPRRAREIRTDARPVRAAVHRLPQVVVREEERDLVDLGEDHRHRADRSDRAWRGRPSPAATAARPARRSRPARCGDRTATRSVLHRRCPGSGDRAPRNRTRPRQPGASRGWKSRRSCRGSPRRLIRFPAARCTRGTGTRCRRPRDRAARSAGCTRSSTCRRRSATRPRPDRPRGG